MNTAFEKMTTEQLAELKKVVDKEIENRQAARHKELFDKMINAIKAFHKEFPYSDCFLYSDYVTCEECGCDTEIRINLFDCIEQLEDRLGLE